MISVVILTYNEEANIQACLDSVAWCDDVLVFDSYSTDKTCAIAEAAGARVIRHRFENYGAQREAARITGAYKHPWVLALDADERPDPELTAELKAVSAMNDGGPHAYRLRRKDHFQEKWIKHATLYPSWFVRFYRWEKIYYATRGVHEYPEVEGPVGSLQGHLLHYSFNKGLGEWWGKHIRYAELEAKEGLKSLDKPLRWGAFLSKDPVARRRVLKDLAARMPFRSALRFLYGYLWHGGILDGGAGLDYCLMLATYEYMIVLNMRDQTKRRSLTLDSAYLAAYPKTAGHETAGHEGK